VIFLHVATRSADRADWVNPRESRNHGSEEYEAGQKCVEGKSWACDKQT